MNFITVNPTVGVDSLADQTLCNGDNTLAVNFTSSLDDNTNNIEEGTITYSWVNDNTNIGLAASGDGDISSFVATNGTTGEISDNITVTSVYTYNEVSCEGESETNITSQYTYNDV